MCVIVRRKWTSILFGPHFPRPINDDSARSAGCFCWLVHSFPEIFSLQLAWGEARKSSRNLAPGRLSFCTPGSFVHNRYCLCELKLFVLRWEEGVAEGVRKPRRGLDSVGRSLLMTYSGRLSHSNKLTPCLFCGLGPKQHLFTRSYRLLHSTSSLFSLCVPSSIFTKKREMWGCSGNIWLHINCWLSCLFFWAIRTFHKGLDLYRTDWAFIWRGSLATRWDTRQRKRAGLKGGSHCDKWLWTFVDFISIHYCGGATGAGLHPRGVRPGVGGSRLIQSSACQREANWYKCVIVALI